MSKVDQLETQIPILSFNVGKETYQLSGNIITGAIHTISTKTGACICPSKECYVTNYHVRTILPPNFLSTHSTAPCINRSGIAKSLACDTCSSIVFSCGAEVQRFVNKVFSSKK